MRTRVLVALVAVAVAVAVAIPGAAADENDVPTAGLVTWLRGDAASVTQSDGVVTAWASRNSGVAAQARVGFDDERPVYDATAVNGLGAVHFDGTDDRMEMAFSANPADMPTITVFAAFRSDTAAPSPYRKLWGNDDGGYDRTVGIDDRGPQSCNYGFFGGNSGGFSDYFGLEADTTYVTTDIYTPTEFRGRVNGDPAVVSAVDNGPGFPTTFRCPPRRRRNVEFWMGDIAEFIVYNRDLSLAERDAVESYLMQRYAVTADPVECGVVPPPPDPGEGTPTPTPTTTSPGQEPAPFEPGVSHVDGNGSERVEDIAIDACQVLVPSADGARAVILARDDVFADALAGAPLAGNDACILFTAGGPGATLDAETRVEIDRVLRTGGPVLVLGGPNAVSSTVESTLTSSGYAVERFQGQTRFETAIAIARRVRSLNPGGTSAMVAFAYNWPDAVTAGAYGAATGTPILLSETPALHPATQDWFLVDGTQSAVGIGGSAVLADAVIAALPQGRRISGPNRMATAVAVTDQLWSGVASADGQQFVVANIERTDGWTVALAAAPLSAKEGAPQLGVAADRYPPETQNYLRARGFQTLPAIVLIGNAAFISDNVAEQISADISQ